MEKRSRRRIRDLVTQPASEGLSENESGCARISMMARSTNAPFTGRIQKRKTNHLRPFTSGLQRTAGPYSWVTLTKLDARQYRAPFPRVANWAFIITFSVRAWRSPNRQAPDRAPN